MNPPAHTAPHWLTTEEQLAWRSYLRMGQALNLALERNLQDTGLSQADYGILVALSEAPGRSLRGLELGKTLHWEKSRLSHQLRRMESRGLIAKASCAEDGRGVVFSLTSQGLAAIEAAAPVHVAAVRDLFVDLLGPERLRLVGEAADAVLARIEANCDSEGCCG